MYLNTIPQILYNEVLIFICNSHRYPPEKFPVYALRGAPAAFPVLPNHRQLQRYMEFSEGISRFCDKYINENFPGEKFIGIHLRNGNDWVSKHYTQTCYHESNTRMHFKLIRNLVQY